MGVSEAKGGPVIQIGVRGTAFYCCHDIERKQLTTLSRSYRMCNYE